MKIVFLLSVLFYSAFVMAMPKKVSLSSEEDFGTARMHDPYPIYVLSPYNTDEHQRPSLNALRGLNTYDLAYNTYPKRIDSIGAGHLI